MGAVHSALASASSDTPRIGTANEQARRAEFTISFRNDLRSRS